MNPEQDLALAHFVGKWQQREPEMQFAEVFCPEPLKLRFRAWGGLLHEFRESMFELSDARVCAIKTGWWAEEMIGLGQGRQRHPLTSVLVGVDAPWSALGRALLDRDVGDLRAEDTGQAVALLLPTARAVLAVESAVFGASESEDAARSLAVHWLLQRLQQGLAAEDRARIPMHLFARHGISAAQPQAGQAEPLLRDWGRELTAAMPGRVSGAALLRRSRHRFDQTELARLAAGRGLAGAASPLSFRRAWRAARSP
ncbi:MAG: hypothetical protein KAY12_05085 [Arenimonas sp.]|nr:hypothetical protein [Arenimonas sp.]